MNSRPSNPGRDHSRWAQALLVFLVALMLFIALLSGMNPLYEISFWWIAALIVLSFIGLLISKVHEPPSAGGFRCGSPPIPSSCCTCPTPSRSSA